MTEPPFDPDSDVEAGDPKGWAAVEHARRRAPGMVLSVRIGAELGGALQSLARVKGTTMSEMARRLLADAVASTWPPTTVNLRVTDRLSVTYGHGPSTTGGESKSRTYEELGLEATA